MNIEEIKRRVDLLKKVNNEKYCLISELAREMKISKTDLMQFIEDNNKLFSCRPIDKQTSKKTSKNLGLAITDVYLNAYENPVTEEWLEKKINDYQNYIHVSEIEYYGSIQGYYIVIDAEKESNNREHLWRNTREKINKLIKQGLVTKYNFCIGGIGDCYNRVCEHALLGDWKNKLKENGWVFNDDSLN